MLEVSAGGVVFNSDKILLLRKESGGWVLPKGHIEEGESISDTALREVKEESGVDAILGIYIDSIDYQYFNFQKKRKSKKTVHWFTMYASDENLYPQKEEGFREARYVDSKLALKILIHKNEKNIIKKAIKLNEREDF